MAEFFSKFPSKQVHAKDNYNPLPRTHISRESDTDSKGDVLPPPAIPVVCRRAEAALAYSQRSGCSSSSTMRRRSREMMTKSVFVHLWLNSIK